MRILHLADRLSNRGGADWHLFTLLSHLRLKHQLLLAVGRHDNTVAAPCRWTVVPGLDAPHRQACTLDSLVDRFEPDVIHLHNVINPDVLDWAGGHRTIIMVQDHRFFCPGPGKWFRRQEVCREPLALERCQDCLGHRDYGQRMFDRTQERLDPLRRRPVVVLSEYMASSLADAGVPQENIVVIPPFVHGLGDSPLAGERPYALFVGRLVPAKGVFDALEAHRRSAIPYPLLFAGTGSARNELEARGGQVLGWQSREQLRELYGRARVVIMPSRWQEPFGIVGLEALALGASVAAWSSGGFAEWHPKSNDLPPWGDVVALADEIVEAATNEPPRWSFLAPAHLMARLENLYEVTASALGPCVSPSAVVR